MRTVLLAVALVPFVYFGARDQLFHTRGRAVGWSEHVLHLAIGVTLFMVVAQAFRRSYPSLLAALVLFIIVGGIDEFLFHRRIPGEESDLHAKQHLALMSWLVLALLTDWLSANGLPLASWSP